MSNEKCQYCGRPLAGEICPAHGYVGNPIPVTPIDRAPSGVLTASATNSYSSASAGTPLAYTGATVTLTPGTWLVSAGAFQYQSVGFGGACLSVYDTTDGSEVANARGPGATGSATSGSVITSRPTVVTVTANKNLCPYILVAAATIAQGNGLAGGPTAYIVAQRIG